MRRVLGIEYDGTAFNGWQVQQDGRSVQGCLEEALSAVADRPVKATAAGRTDTGVHAVGQVVHFDTDAARPDRAWTLGVNAALPADVAVRWVRAAPDGFHARYAARARSYRYCILNGPLRSALLRHRAWWVRRPLDAAAMTRAGEALVGEHDFSAFRAAECQARTASRNLTHLEVRRDGDLLTVDVSANAFLHHMVRNIVGTLAVVGRGEAEPDWVAEVLAGRDRREGGMTAPAAGLYLLRVDYGGLLSQPTPIPPLGLETGG